MIHEGFTVLAVVTQPDRASGRHKIPHPCPVAQAAAAYKVNLFQPVSLKRDKNIRKKLADLGADVFVVVAYGSMIPDELLALPPFGVINVHPSLLPRHRGPTPMPSAILAGDEVTGISIMKLDHEMDHGPILAQLEIPLTSDMDTPALEQIVTYKGPVLLADTLEAYRKGHLKPREQAHERATYCQLLTRDSGRLDWKESAEQLDRTIRAYRPWPGTWTTWKRKRLKILDAALAAGSLLKPAGTVYEEGGYVYISCHRGSILLKQLQLEGGKPLSIRDFLRGYKDFVGSRVE